MTAPESRPIIVVGVDGSQTSKEALRWAAKQGQLKRGKGQQRDRVLVTRGGRRDREQSSPRAVWERKDRARRGDHTAHGPLGCRVGHPPCRRSLRRPGCASMAMAGSHVRGRRLKHGGETHGVAAVSPDGARMCCGRVRFIRKTLPLLHITARTSKDVGLQPLDRSLREGG